MAGQAKSDMVIDVVFADSASGPVATLARLARGSVLVHAPRPALDNKKAPIGPGFLFPREAVVWDLDLDPDAALLRHARTQEADMGLKLQTGEDHYRVSLALILGEIFAVDADEALTRSATDAAMLTAQAGDGVNA